MIQLNTFLCFISSYTPLNFIHQFCMLYCQHLRFSLNQLSSCLILNYHFGSWICLNVERICNGLQDKRTKSCLQTSNQQKEEIHMLEIQRFLLQQLQLQQHFLRQQSVKRNNKYLENKKCRILTKSHAAAKTDFILSGA